MDIREKLREKSIEKIKKNMFGVTDKGELGKYLNYKDTYDFIFQTFPTGKKVTFTFIENDDDEDYNMVEKTGFVNERTIETVNFRGEEEEKKCFIVNCDGDKFLVPLFEIQASLESFVTENINKFFDVEKFIEDNYKEIQDISNFNFLTDTKFGLEIEGGWNGILELSRFRRTTDNSFQIEDKQNNDEFVYRGCAKANKLLIDLFDNIPNLISHNFAYKRTCGTHIHFSDFGLGSDKGRGFEDETFFKLISFLITFEDVIFDIIPSYRVGTIDKLNGELYRDGGYSKSIYHARTNFLQTVEEIKYRLKNKQINKENSKRLKEKLMANWYNEHFETRGEKYNMTRYYGINLHSYFYRGSMELRHFEGNYRNTPYYLDLIDKIMYTIKNVDWTIINNLMETLDNYNNIATKSCALLYALGVNNKTLSKLLSRTDYTKLNLVKSHKLLNSIRSQITNIPAEITIDFDKEKENLRDTTCYNDINQNEDYTSKHRVVEKIAERKAEIRQDLDFNMLLSGEYTGQDKEEFKEYLNRISQNLERGE